MPILSRGSRGTPKPYFGLVYGNGRGYDRVRVTRTKDGVDVVADLGVGEWSDPVADEFVIDDEAVRGTFRLKLIGLSPSADEFELFATQVWPTGGDFAVPGGTAEELYEAVGPFIQNPARDALGFFDDDTYFELLDEHHLRLGDYAVHLGTTREWDVLFAETHASDYASHFFLGQADPISGADEATLERCRRGLERTWRSIDLMVGRILDLVDDETLVAIVSDHGGTPSKHTPVDVNEVLQDAGLLAYAPDGSVDAARTKALGIGLVHVFVNLKGREPDGIVEPGDYAAMQEQIVDTLLTFRDLETGERPFTLALTHADAEMLNLTGELVGDVVYALKPEYDGAHGKQLPSVSFGIAGQHSTFILAGPGVKTGELLRQVRAVDVIPTVAYLLGLPMPANVEGGVVYEALEDPDWPLTALARA
jgi:arylsulfatase A-like enzyme